jgi:hypothetical protein
MDEEAELNPGPPSPAKEERKRILSTALSALNPRLQAFPFDYADLGRVQHIDEEEARKRFRHIELNGSEDGNGIQVTLADDTATITIPYWHHGAAALETFTEVWAYLTLLERDGGLRPFDPQLERPLVLESDLEAVLAKYAEGVAFTDKIAAEYRAKAIPPKPWWRLW